MLVGVGRGRWAVLYNYVINRQVSDNCTQLGFSPRNFRVVVNTRIIIPQKHGFLVGQWHVIYSRDQCGQKQ